MTASSELAKFRSSLLTAARAPIDAHACPAPVRKAVAQFEDAVSSEVRQLLVGGRPFYEVLCTFQFDNGDEELEPSEFISGLIVDANGTELVDLDFEQRLATFIASPEETDRNRQLAAFLDGHFTKASLDGGALARSLVPMPKALEESIDGAPDTAKVYRFEFDGRWYFAKRYLPHEVLIFDAQHRTLGGSAEVGVEPFDVAEVEASSPLGPAPAAVAGAKGNDAFEAARKPKVVF